VGAAVVALDEEVFTGSNVENASYGLSMCAERVAIFSAIAAGASKVERIAICCPKADPNRSNQLMPCGACRQVMAEFMSADADVTIDGVGTFKLSVLLPEPFRFQTK